MFKFSTNSICLESVQKFLDFVALPMSVCVCVGANNFSFLQSAKQLDFRFRYIFSVALEWPCVRIQPSYENPKFEWEDIAECNHRFRITDAIGDSKEKLRLHRIVMPMHLPEKIFSCIGQNSIYFKNPLWNIEKLKYWSTENQCDTMIWFFFPWNT